MKKNGKKNNSIFKKKIKRIKKEYECKKNVFNIALHCIIPFLHVLFHEDSLLSAHDFPSEMNKKPTFFYFFNVLLEDEI